MLVLGCLLLADILWNQNFFVSGLNFWPLIIMGLGMEILISWLTIRRKKLPESIRLDGRSLGLLFLVGVFSVNFYLSTVRAAKGPVETPVPQETLFNVKKKNVSLPQQDVTLSPDVKQVVIQNPLGDVDVVTSKDDQLHILPQVHLYNTGGDAELTANQLSPYVTVGASTLVAVRPDLIYPQNPNQPAPGTVDLQVQVPEGYELLIRNDQGDIKVSGYRGNMSVFAKSGRVNIDRLKGKLAVDDLDGAVTVSNILGNANLTSEQRGVTATGISGNLTVKSAEGDCTISKVFGELDIDANNGEVNVDTVDGDIVAFSNSGLLTIKNANSAVMGTVNNGDIKMSGKVLGQWTLISTNGSVRMTLSKDSSIQFTGVTNKGVIKGPTKQSPSGGTKPGAYLTDSMGDGVFPVMVRCDNGSIFVNVQ